MHHPGPPRFVQVGEAVELAPRSPDPAATFTWNILDRPDESQVTIGDSPVAHLTPDTPGTYRAELNAPDGSHIQTVRAFPDPRREARFSVAREDVDGDVDHVESATVIGKFNDFTMGIHQAERNGDEWTIDVELPPGDHEAIFTFGEEFDPFATTTTVVEGPGRPRLHLNGHEEDDEVVLTATTESAPDGDNPAVEFYFDDRDALGNDDVTIDGKELRVPTGSLPETARVHAVPVAERHGIADTLLIQRDETGAVSFDRPADAPEWLRNATLYEIFVREFAGETVDTTFEEIERRVPYLESLGVDAVWLTPVLESPTRHGYHITDFFDTATDLGSRREFKSLVERLHAAGIKVLFDLVINHTSRDHPNFQLHRAGVTEYADYYERIPAEQDMTGVDWAGDDAPGHYFSWKMIPNVNYDSLAVRAWMLDVLDEWAPLVDGFRCDVAWGVSHGFWKEARERLKSEDSDFLLLDETVPRDADFRENEFDFHYDTDLYYTLREIGNNEAPATAIFDALAASQRHGYPDDAIHMRYVENHDEDRYATECEEGTLRPAAAATFTLPGVPMIYYGQERGVPEDRGTMRWHDGDAELTTFHRRLVELRNELPALRSPTVDPITYETSETDGDRVVAYERTGGDTRLAVVLNFGADPTIVRLDPAVNSEDLLSGTDIGNGDGIQVHDVAILKLT